jgi:hypothetical protein
MEHRLSAAFSLWFGSHVEQCSTLLARLNRSLKSRFREVRRDGGDTVLVECIGMSFNGRDKLLT